MKNYIFAFIVMAVSGCIYLGCQSSEKKVTEGWSTSMQELSGELKDILPFIYSEVEFRDEKNREKIQVGVLKLSKTSHNISPELGDKVAGDDPIIQHSLASLSKDIDLAYQTYNEGNFEFSNGLLKESLRHCFRCHTRANIGPEFKGLNMNFSGLRISPIEKAEVYVALRQYDSALQLLQGNITSGINFYEQPYVQERALERYLALMVRVKKDYLKSIQTLDQFLDKANLPFYLVENVKAWKKSLVFWQKRKMDYKAANQMLKRATQLQEDISFQAGMVEYLLATQILHSTLAEQKNPSDKAKVYSQLGSAYEALIDLGYWSLPEVYYEACVDMVPNTKLAQSCFRDFERNVVLGYSGSAGVFIPKEERDKIKKLRTVAFGQ